MVGDPAAPMLASTYDFGARDFAVAAFAADTCVPEQGTPFLARLAAWRHLFDDGHIQPRSATAVSTRLSPNATLVRNPRGGIPVGADAAAVLRPRRRPTDLC